MDSRNTDSIGSARTQLCLLSDTHGILDPRILDLAQNCDHIVHAGDIGNGEILSRLTETGHPLTVIRGNNDTPAKWPPEDLGQLRELPDQAFIDLPGGTLAVEHGHRVNPVAQRHHKLRLKYPHCRAVLYGHSHLLVLDRDQRPWILNPGAAGRGRTFGGPSCLLLVAAPERWLVQEKRFSKLP